MLNFKPQLQQDPTGNAATDPKASRASSKSRNHREVSKSANNQTFAANIDANSVGAARTKQNGHRTINYRIRSGNPTAKDRRNNAMLETLGNKLPQHMEVFGKPNLMISTKGIVDGELCFNSLGSLSGKELVDLSEVYKSGHTLNYSSFKRKGAALNEV